MGKLFTNQIFLAVLFGAVVLVVFLFVALPMISSALNGHSYSFAAIGIPEKSGSALYRSFDRGETWKRVFPQEGGSRDATILDFEYHPLRSAEIILGTLGSGLWRSNNLGIRWERMLDDSGFLTEESTVYGVTYGKSNPAVFYVSLDTGSGNVVLRSRNGGKTFKEIYRVTKGGGSIRRIAVDPAYSNHLFLGASDGAFFESRDGGETWRTLERFSASVRGIFMPQKDASEFFVYLESGHVYRTQDGGGSWEEISFGVGEEKGARAIMRIPQPEGESSAVPNFFTNPFSSGGGVYDFSVDPKDFSLLTAITKDGVIRSSDGGETWEPVETLVRPADETAGSVATIPGVYSSIVFSFGSDFYRSDDSGITWRKKILPGSVAKLITYPADSEVLFSVVK